MLHDLVHALDRDRFAPVVVSAAKTEAPPAYDPAVPVHYLSDIAREKASGRRQAVHLPIPLHRRLYQRVSPSVREKLNLGTRLRRLCRAMGIYDESEASLVHHSMEGRMLPGLFARYWDRAVALNRFFASLPDDAILVPVMEYMSVLSWLAQIPSHRHCVISLHTLESDFFRTAFPDASRHDAEVWLFRSACHCASSVVVPSAGCRDDLTDQLGIRPGRIRVLRNGVDAAMIRRRSREPVPTDVHGPASRTIFVHVGRLQTEKNHELLIDACRLLKTKYPDFLVICLGDGPRRVALQKKIDAQGLQDHVLLLGYRDNPYAYMGMARAVVLTSHVESFALVLVEAMLSGSVALSVDCPVGPREVLEGGRSGLLVPPDSPAALAQAMLQIALDDDLHGRLKAAGAARALYYDVGSVIPEWMRLFDELVPHSD